MVRRPFSILLLIAIVAGCAARVDRIAVRSSELAVTGDVAEQVEQAWSSDPPDGAFPLRAHRIQDGRSVVLSRREYHPGRIDVTDYEHFSKLSLVVPQIDSDAVFEIGEDGVSLIYSAGISAFPDRACVSYGSSGTVEVKHESAGTVHVRMSAQTASDARARGCGGRRLEDEGSYELVPRANLTPWLGGPFDSLDQASFP